MNEPFELRGQWWLPSNTNKILEGVLEFDGKSYPILTLSGEFQSIVEEEQPQLFIHGFTVKGKQVSLYKCSMSNMSRSYPGLPVQSYAVNIVFFGHHYHRENEIKFDSFGFSMSGLEEWLGYKVFRHEPKPEKNVDYKVELKTPKNIRYEIENYILSIIYTFRINGGTYREHLMGSRAWLRFEFQELIGLPEMYHIIQTYSDFLTICMGFRPVLLKLQIRTNNEEKQFNDVVYYLYQEQSKKPFPFLMPLSYHSLIDDFQNYLEKWILARTSFEPTFDLYFSTLFNKFVHPIHEFLSLVTAFESYYREKIPIKNHAILSVELFSKLSDLVSSQIIRTITSKESRQSFLDRLPFWNEKSLRKKMKDIYALYPDEFDKYIQNKSDFINKTVNTRNYYTHYDEKSKNEVIPYNELWKYAQNLKIMLYIVILKELSLERDVFSKAIDNWIYFTTYSNVEYE